MWALTIAGGRGERLRPLTDGICKPMVPVNGAPLLQHQARWLCENGVTDIVFLTGYRAEQVEEHTSATALGLDFVRTIRRRINR